MLGAHSSGRGRRGIRARTSGARHIASDVVGRHRELCQSGHSEQDDHEDHIESRKALTNEGREGGEEDKQQNQVHGTTEQRSTEDERVCRSAGRRQ